MSSDLYNLKRDDGGIKENIGKVAIEMIIISVDDFMKKAEAAGRLDRKQEIEFAKKMKDGDASARERLIESYLPTVAAHIRRTNVGKDSLSLVCYCVDGLEKAVDAFDFLQDSETFTHRLSWYLRQATTRFVVDSREEC